MSRSSAVRRAWARSPGCPILTVMAAITYSAILLIIGGGPAGLAAGLTAARAGLRVALDKGDFRAWVADCSPGGI